MREFPQILVFISKHVRISTNSEVKTKKKGLRPQTYVNFHEFWSEATKTNRVYCKMYEKNVLTHEFWCDHRRSQDF